jgi:hypothetical protein
MGCGASKAVAVEQSMGAVGGTADANQAAADDAEAKERHNSDPLDPPEEPAKYVTCHVLLCSPTPVQPNR